MTATDPDPTEPIAALALTLDGVSESTSCTQRAFRVGANAFLYVGPQGGQFKAMFKLVASMEDARARAAAEPDRFNVGSTRWVTARFTSAKPMPTRLWKAWLKESYAAASGPASARDTKKKASKGRKKSSSASRSTPASPRRTTRKTAPRKASKRAASSGRRPAR